MSNLICEISSIPQEIALIGSLDKSLCRSKGEVVPMQNLLLNLWGDDDFFNARSLQVLITRLRHRFSKDSRIRIVNVRGTGYKLIAE